MFSKQMQIVFRALANLFLFLAAMPADATNVEMSATDYLKAIDAADVPDQGTDVTPVITGTAADVFATNDDVHDEGSHLMPDAAAVFAPEPQGDPIYTMTAKAEGFDKQAYSVQGWTDDDLVEHGYMTITYPAPAAPVLAAPPAAPARPPVPPQPIPGQQAAMQAVEDSNAAFKTETAVMLDVNGLPWDARIHASTRTQTEAGAWKKKKGASDVDVARVTAELLQKTAAAAPVKTPFVPLAAPQQEAHVPVAPPVVVAPPAPASAPPAPATGATNAPVTTFAELCKWITANGLTMHQGLAAAQVFDASIAAMGFLAQPNHAYLIPMIHEELAKLRA